MPSDQDIIKHYEKKLGTSSQMMMSARKAALQKFTYTLDIPDEVLATLNGTNGQAEVEAPPPITDGVSNIDISAQPDADDQEW